jgi:cytochrome c oxidase subunit 2
MARKGFLTFLVSGLLLTACGGGESAGLSGEELAADIGCLSCHQEDATGIAPSLHGIWGTEVSLEDGSTVTVDEEYVRRSITDPGADIVDGYTAAMPTFPLNESEVDRLVEWVGSLG